jgi:hypothetical protein
LRDKFSSYISLSSITRTKPPFVISPSQSHHPAAQALATALPHDISTQPTHPSFSLSLSLSYYAGGGITALHAPSLSSTSLALNSLLGLPAFGHKFTGAKHLPPPQQVDKHTLPATGQSLKVVQSDRAAQLFGMLQNPAPSSSGWQTQYCAPLPQGVKPHTSTLLQVLTGRQMPLWHLVEEGHYVSQLLALAFSGERVNE